LPIRDYGQEIPCSNKRGMIMKIIAEAKSKFFMKRAE